MLKSGQLGLQHFYRFTDPQWEEQYHTRRVRWCFWPAIIHLYSNFFLEALALVGFILGSPDLPSIFWVKVALEAVTLAFILGLHCSDTVRQHIFLVHSVFMWLVVAYYVGTMHYMVELWTDQSYSALVPPSFTVVIEGPGGQQNIGAKLSDHLAMLAAYRAVQVTIGYTMGLWVHNMVRGLHWWSLTTSVWIFVVLVVGMLLNPGADPLSVVLTSLAVGTVTLLTLLFTAVFERMQRQNFEAERLLAWELQASRMADSVLNHTLKNTLADVAGNVEMFLSGALESKALGECILSLRRGMRSCKERLVYLKLAAGQYEPVLNAVHLGDFGRQLIAGRDAMGQFPDVTVYADQMLLTLICDNALSNAAKHGNPRCPDVQFSIAELPRDGGGGDGRRRFCFQVTNNANPERLPLTPQWVAQLFAGKASAGGEGGVSPVLSDRIGLTHCLLAAQQGGIALSLTQEDDLVTFRGVFDAQLASGDTYRLPAHPLPSSKSLDFPPGLRFVILDDSVAAQRLLKFHIEKWCDPRSVVCLGASPDDVERFLIHALDADIVIIDQHLEWDEPWLGVDLVRQLRTSRCPAFLCIRSADDGPDDQERYRRAGAHCSVGKDLLGQVMLQQLKEAYEAFRFSQQSMSSFAMTRTLLPITRRISTSTTELSTPTDPHASDLMPFCVPHTTLQLDD